MESEIKSQQLKKDTNIIVKPADKGQLQLFLTKKNT